MNLGRFVLAALVAAAMYSPAASAVELRSPDGLVPQPFQRWADDSHVPTVDQRVTLHRNAERCALERAIWGCASRAGFVVVAAPVGRRRQTLLHELGHLFEFEMPAWKRDRFSQIFGSWDVEVFAETYANCAKSRRAQPRTDFMPTLGSYRRACRLIRA
jgi:hypothetical protein